MVLEVPVLRVRRLHSQHQHRRHLLHLLHFRHDGIRGFTAAAQPLKGSGVIRSRAEFPTSDYFRPYRAPGTTSNYSRPLLTKSFQCRIALKSMLNSPRFCQR